jgi:hypothetical protein
MDPLTDHCPPGCVDDHLDRILADRPFEHSSAPVMVRTGLTDHNWVEAELAVRHHRSQASNTVSITYPDGDGVELAERQLGELVAALGAPATIDRPDRRSGNIRRRGLSERRMVARSDPGRRAEAPAQT